MNNSIAAIILTKNEAKHIVRCIESLQDVCDEVIVVDSLSTDNTCELAESMGARVYKNPWKTMPRSLIMGCMNVIFSRNGFGALMLTSS